MSGNLFSLMLKLTEIWLRISAVMERVLFVFKKIQFKFTLWNGTGRVVIEIPLQKISILSYSFKFGKSNYYISVDILQTEN